jgi:hypothetical protein
MYAGYPMFLIWHIFYGPSSSSFLRVLDVTFAWLVFLKSINFMLEKSNENIADKTFMWRRNVQVMLFFTSYYPIIL